MKFSIITSLVVVFLSQSAFSQKCLLPMDFGSCDGASTKYFYNKEKNHCEAFSYSGCGGNANKFDSLTDCKKACVLALKDGHKVSGTTSNTGSTTDSAQIIHVDTTLQSSDPWVDNTLPIDSFNHVDSHLMVDHHSDPNSMVDPQAIVDPLIMADPQAMVDPLIMVDPQGMVDPLIDPLPSAGSANGVLDSFTTGSSNSAMEAAWPSDRDFGRFRDFRGDGRDNRRRNRFDEGRFGRRGDNYRRGDRNGRGDFDRFRGDFRRGREGRRGDRYDGRRGDRNYFRNGDDRRRFRGEGRRDRNRGEGRRDRNRGDGRRRNRGDFNIIYRRD